MNFNEWKKLKHVSEFVDSLDESEHPVVLHARVMRFCFEQGQAITKEHTAETNKINKYMWSICQAIIETKLKKLIKLEKEGGRSK